MKTFDHSSIEVGNDVQLGGVVRALLSIMDMDRIGLLNLEKHQMGDLGFMTYLPFGPARPLWH
jgi:hypothetical protein